MKTYYTSESIGPHKYLAGQWWDNVICFIIMFFLCTIGGLGVRDACRSEHEILHARQREAVRAKEEEEEEEGTYSIFGIKIRGQDSLRLALE